MITVLIYWWAIYGWRVDCAKEFVAFISCAELFVELFFIVLSIVIWWNDRR